MFQKARIKLTFWYLIIIMFVSLTFSTLVYNLLVGEVVRFEQMQRAHIERRLREGDFGFGEGRRRVILSPLPSSPELIEEAKQRVIYNLTMINLAVFLASAGLGYVLAGRTLNPIREMVDEQHRFISDASHELRTPLTSLKSAFEVFLRDKNPNLPDAKLLAQESLEDVNRLQALSESMLFLTQYQNPNGNFKMETLSLKQLLSQAIRRVSPLAAAKSINIVNNVPTLEIIADKHSLTDLFVILLDNAIKYSPHKSKISISAIKEKGHVQIKLNDQGIGISAKDLPHIFDRFYRADKVRQKKDAGGYGLGLSIAKRIADLHKASLIAESKVGTGSTFILELPESNSK